MGATTYEPELTGLLVVDPYNDFISEGGKLWPSSKETGEGVSCVPQGDHRGQRAIVRQGRSTDGRIGVQTSSAEWSYRDGANQLNPNPTKSKQP
jgi:hypothetical protein